MNQTSKDQIYAGWLYADPEEYDTLRDLGVFGPMIYEDFSSNNQSHPLINFSKQGTICHCFCTKEVLMVLVERYKKWWSENYIHYDEVDQLDYPIARFTKVSTNWLKQRRSSQYTGIDWLGSRSPGE